MNRPSRLERLVNLAAALSDTTQPLTFKEIRARVPGYQRATDEAGRRAFERDKATLRDELGFDVTSTAAGYRMRPADWTMGELDLTAEESAALALAASLVQMGGTSDSSSGGTAAAIARRLFSPATPDPYAAAFTARVITGPAHTAAADAVQRRRTIRFGYRNARDGSLSMRRLDPYALTLRNGRWYVTGRDHDREGNRSFRLDRVDGEIDAGEVGAFEVPRDFDADAAVPSEPWSFNAPTTTARLVLDADVAFWARPQMGDATVVEVRGDGSVVLDCVVSDRAPFIAFVASLLDGAEIVSPGDLRADLIAHLRVLAPQPSQSG